MVRIRCLLHCLTVAMLAFGIASAPLYAVARAADVPTGVRSHYGHLAKDAKVDPDHDHTSAAKSHSAGQTCCHPGCIMAVVPAFAGLTTVSVSWITLAIPRDRGAVPVAPSGLDRPPKPA